MRTPIVSVVIPLYNKELFVRRALESVCRQTFQSYEVVIVDDGSTDQGPRIAESMGFKIIQQGNSGVSAARNRAIAESQAPWVAFLDADDEWHPFFLQRVMSALEAYPQAVAGCSDYSTSAIAKDNSGLDAYLVSDFPAWFVRRRAHAMWTSAVVARKAILESIGGFSNIPGEDTDLWFRIGWSGPIVYVNQVLSFYRQDDQQSVTHVSRASFPSVINTMKEWVDRIPANMAQSTADAESFLLASYALGLAQEKRFGAAFKILFSRLPRWRAVPMYLRAWAGLTGI